MTDKTNKLRERINRIVTCAVEDQMDFEAYYTGDSPEHVQEIMDLIEQALYTSKGEWEKQVKLTEKDIRAEERAKVIEEVEGWLVDEKLTVVAYKYGTNTGEIRKTIGDGEEEWKAPRNDLRAELREKLSKLKG